MRRIFFLVLIVLASSVSARSLNTDCSPSGLVNKAKAIASPESFWKSALVDIDREVEAVYTRIRLMQIDSARDRSNAAFDDQEMRTMGIQPYSDPELDRLMAEGDALIRSNDAAMLRSVKEWASRCRPYATKMLSVQP